MTSTIRCGTPSSAARALSATFRPVATVKETRHADDSVMILEERGFDAESNNQCRRDKPRMHDAWIRRCARLVLLPNAGCSAAYFEHFARRFALAGFQIVAINMRGVASSTGSLAGASLHDLAADVAAVIEAFACAPAHVLGHAFGNRVARCLAADRPDLVRS